MKRGGHAALLSLLLLSFSLLTAGCGLSKKQYSAVATFSDATAVTGRIAAHELMVMRGETISMNAHRIELSGLVSGQPGLFGKDPERYGYGKDLLEFPFSPAATLAVLQAIEALRTYGEALSALVTFTGEDELQKASDSFVAGIESIPDKYSTLTGEQRGALGKFVREAGRLAVEHEKKKAVKSIVVNYRGQVDRLADLLMEDFDSERSGSLASGYFGASMRALKVSVEMMEPNTDPGCQKDPACRKAAERTNACIKELACREKAMANYREALANQKREETVTRRVSASLAELKKANEALAAAVEMDQFSIDSVMEFRKTVKVLVDSVKVLSK